MIKSIIKLKWFFSIFFYNTYIIFSKNNINKKDINFIKNRLKYVNSVNNKLEDPLRGILSQKIDNLIECYGSINPSKYTNKLNVLQNHYEELFENNKLKIFLLPKEFINQEIFQILIILNKFYNSLNTISLDYNDDQDKMIELMENTSKELAVFSGYSIKFWPGNGMGNYDFNRTRNKDDLEANNPFGITSSSYLSCIIKKKNNNIINIFFRDDNFWMEYKITKNFNIRLNYKDGKIKNIEYYPKKNKENDYDIFQIILFENHGNNHDLINNICLRLYNEKRNLEYYNLYISDSDSKKIYENIEPLNKMISSLLVTNNINQPKLDEITESINFVSYPLDINQLKYNNYDKIIINREEEPEVFHRFNNLQKNYPDIFDGNNIIIPFIYFDKNDCDLKELILQLKSFYRSPEMYSTNPEKDFYQNFKSKQYTVEFDCCHHYCFSGVIKKNNKNILYFLLEGGHFSLSYKINKLIKIEITTTRKRVEDINININNKNFINIDIKSSCININIPQQELSIPIKDESLEDFNNKLMKYMEFISV